MRIVESQEQVATRSLVDDLAEQHLLEQLLERSKPPAVPGTAHLHYLLATPFRYPPLRHGSRFGVRHEPSLFYGARDLSAVLAETAYYRSVFWSGMETPPPAGKLDTEHTIFRAGIDAARGLQLHAPPFDSFAARLTDPADYSATQALGTAMRDAQTDAFEFRSARDPDGGINVALFHPGCFDQPAPLSQAQWLCETTPDSVSFRNTEQGYATYPREVFEIDGRLPAPSV